LVCCGHLADFLRSKRHALVVVLPISGRR